MMMVDNGYQWDQNMIKAVYFGCHSMEIIVLSEMIDLVTIATFQFLLLANGHRYFLPFFPLHVFRLI